MLRRLLWSGARADTDAVSRMLQCAPSGLRERLRGYAVQKAAAAAEGGAEVTERMMLDCAPASVQGTLLDCALQRAGTAGDAALVLCVLRDARRMDVAVTARTYNKVIRSWSEVGEMESTLVLLSDMQADARVAPDVTTFNTIMHGFAQQGARDEVYHLYLQSREAGLAPDETTSSILMSAFGDSEPMVTDLSLGAEGGALLGTLRGGDDESRVRDFVLDVRGLPKAVARSVLRQHLEYLRVHVHASELRDLVIVTGTGRASSSGGAGGVGGGVGGSGGGSGSSSSSSRPDSNLRSAITTLLTGESVGFHAPPKNRGRIVIPSSELAQRFDRIQQSEFRQRFLRLGILRYVSIPALLFAGYLVPQLLTM